MNCWSKMSGEPPIDHCRAPALVTVSQTHTLTHTKPPGAVREFIAHFDFYYFLLLPLVLWAHGWCGISSISNKSFFLFALITFKRFFSLCRLHNEFRCRFGFVGVDPPVSVIKLPVTMVAPVSLDCTQKNVKFIYEYFFRLCKI